jgi:hypothetical protein
VSARWRPVTIIGSEEKTVAWKSIASTEPNHAGYRLAQQALYNQPWT